MNKIRKICHGLAGLSLITFIVACASDLPVNDEKLVGISNGFKPKELTDSTQLNHLALMIGGFKANVRKFHGRKIFNTMSYDSQIWLSQMIEAVKNDDRIDLEGREYYEQLTILGLRHSILSGTLKSSEFKDVTRLIFSQGPLRIAFRMKESELGPLTLSTEGGEGRQGLSKSPRVPVYFYIYEDDRWKLDLLRMLPIISRAQETIALKKKMTKVNSIIYLLNVVTSKNYGKAIFEPLEF